MNNTVFWLKNKLFRRNALLQYNEAILSDHLSDIELEKINWEKRKAIVEYAYNNSEFYRRFYNENDFNPSLLYSENDWDKVPVLEKKDIREHLEEIRDIKIPRKYIGTATTGGSTGMPLKIYTDKRFHFEILAWRAFRWWKISPADNVGIIHRSVPTSVLGRLINRCLWWPTKRAYLDASSMKDSDISAFVNQLNDLKIKWLVGYVGGIEIVADYVLKHNIRINTVCMVWSTSAPLLDFVREKLEKAFHCKIMDQYGCNELAHIAIQCPECDGLHVNSDFVHVDIVDENDKMVETGIYGDILVTNLESKAFPIIKYRLGDKSKFLSRKCSCGLSYPLLKSISGRITDSILTPSGIILESIYLTSIFDDYTDCVQNFRIYQKSDYSVEVLVVANKSKQKEAVDVLQKVKNTLQSKVNNEIDISIKQVDEIQHDRGKNRYIISDITLHQSNKPNE